MGKLLSIHISMDLSVNPSGSLSITLSPSAENLSKVSGNNGEKDVLHYQHGFPVKSPPIHATLVALFHALFIPAICTTCIKSVLHLFHALSVPSVHNHSLPMLLHPSMHHPFCLSICPMMNITKSQTNPLVLIMGRKTCLKS